MAGIEQQQPLIQKQIQTLSFGLLKNPIVDKFLTNGPGATDVATNKMNKYVISRNAVLAEIKKQLQSKFANSSEKELTESADALLFALMQFARCGSEGFTEASKERASKMLAEEYALARRNRQMLSKT